MAKDVRLPQLGQTMEEGTVVNCLVKVGDEVKKGDVIFEIETDKATLEMESPADGFVKHILVSVDETLAVGEPMLVLGDKNEDVPQSFVDSLKGGAPAAPEATPAAQAAPATEPAEPEPEPAKPAGRIMASPRAKKLAADMGVDLTTVKGTGSGGKITEEDVKNAGAGKPSKPAAPAASAAEARPGQTIPLNRLQRITAERMLRSKQEIPCFYLTVKADVTDLVELRTRLNQSGDVKLSYNDFIVKAVATGLEKFPIMTGQLDGEVIKLAETINVGLAISVPDGLVAPILKDVNKKNVRRIATDSLALIDRARGNKLQPTDLEGGCITVSNLGAFGIDNFIPIVVPGQCSILGIGQITDTCVPDNGNILVRKLMNMTLSVDHKVANGAYAAQFLDFVRKQLEDTSTFDLKS
jgi:pyruvate dehydrogenase E2 component (dihydrolipoamide acetyltransferase)